MLSGSRALAASLLLFAALPTATAAAHDGHDADVHPEAWILVDADSGAVLSAHNDHEALPPASVVKVMTALVALEEAPLDSEITVSADAASRPARRIAMREGQVWPLEDALASMLIVSANDAAWAVAEGVSGDLDSFADDAERIGERYGMQDSTFADPAGLDDGVYSHGEGSRFSAYDLAIAARNFLAVPELAQLPPLPTYEFTGPDGVPHRLLGQNTLIGTYDGATGLKTGSTERAGHTFIATAERDGRTMIAVVMGTADPYGHAARLLDQGFATEPAAEGIGETLPAVAVTTHDMRSAFLGGAPPTLRPLVEAAFAASVRGYEWVQPPTPTAEQGVDDPDGAGATVQDSNADDGAGAPWVWILVGAAGSLLFLLLARRRSVMARRRLREARRRELAEAARRGTIHVVQSAGGQSEGERVRKHPSMRGRDGRRVGVGVPPGRADR